ncbi:hypothetical protein RIF29_27101 [Crotalaria pallida]|uniref:Uncharacterized protein n=1 Tax=Crotalaria pallida TaxID=3830 RepID=A0AAN9EPE9_CROPI
MHSLSHVVYKEFILKKGCKKAVSLFEGPASFKCYFGINRNELITKGRGKVYPCLKDSIKSCVGCWEKVQRLFFSLNINMWEFSWLLLQF